ncbi:MAG: plastocyanin/azurin family copper-binding protein [Gemmatimonadales bacterium]
MRSAFVTMILAVGALACGGGDTQADQSQTPPAPPAAPAAGAGGGEVVEVRMTGNGTTQAAYEPSSLTISPGTTVRFINVSGGPHNIAFWTDSIPSGAAAPLGAGMPNTIDNLVGPFLTEPNATYDVSFANAPTGQYKGYCTPHMALGMRIAITVQ